MESKWADKKKPFLRSQCKNAIKKSLYPWIKQEEIFFLLGGSWSIWFVKQTKNVFWQLSVQDSEMHWILTRRPYSLLGKYTAD